MAKEPEISQKISNVFVHIHVFIYSSPKQQILDSSKLEEFVDLNFKLGENGRKLSKWVEKTVGKGVIAHYEQVFLI